MSEALASAAGRDVVLEARKVTRILPATVPVTLVKDISVAFASGEFCVITGPSGSGKSSLLYLLGLLDLPTSGEVLVDGRETSLLPPNELADLRLRKIGFVFQFHFLLPEFDCLRNIMVPMRRLGGMTEPEMRDRAMGLLDHFGIADNAAKRPDQLSGGQRQRVAVARALANDPEIILADEPTGNLDTHNSAIVHEMFVSLAKDEGKTVVAVTHEMDFTKGAHRRLHLVDGKVDTDHRNGDAAARD